MTGKRYGYLDMPEGWSDVNATPVRVPCVSCGCLTSCVVEDTWIEDRRTVTYCGCEGRAERWAEIAAETMADWEAEQYARWEGRIT